MKIFYVLLAIGLAGCTDQGVVTTEDTVPGKDQGDSPLSLHPVEPQKDIPNNSPGESSQKPINPIPDSKQKSNDNISTTTPKPLVLEEMLKEWVMSHYYASNKDSVNSRADTWPGLFVGLNRDLELVGPLKHLYSLTIQYFSTYANLLGCFVFGRDVDSRKGACLRAQIIYSPTVDVEADVDLAGDLARYFANKLPGIRNLKRNTIELSRLHVTADPVEGLNEVLNYIMTWPALKNYSVIGISLAPILIANVVTSDGMIMWDPRREPGDYLTLSSTYIHVARRV